MSIIPENQRDFSALLEVVKALRGPDGCPWDKEQTHESLTQYALEEAHEFAEAIDKGDKKEIIEELGDMLFQVVLHAEIARQSGEFTIEDVIATVNEKMIRRHPHVFSDVEVKDSNEVLNNWQDIKAKEKGKKEINNDNPFNVPVNLPALIRAQKIGGKTTKYNFDWANTKEVLFKVEEELGELKEAIDIKSKEEQQHELGDLLFSVSQVARHLNFDAEQSLRICNQRFEKRFLKMKELAAKQELNFENLSHNEMEELYKNAKTQLNGPNK